MYKSVPSSFRIHMVILSNCAFLMQSDSSCVYSLLVSLLNENVFCLVAQVQETVYKLFVQYLYLHMETN